VQSAKAVAGSGEPMKRRDFITGIASAMSWPLVGAQLQSAMPFQRRQERRDHDHQPLAA
jgi:hypothetical protein